MSNPAQDNDDVTMTTGAAGSGPSVALSALNQKLAGKSGKLFWKSFEELAETDEFKKWVEDEFPNRATIMEFDRRKFLTISGAALAMAGLSGCRILPQTKAVPYVRAPEEMVVGKSLLYSSALTRGGYGLGVLVESREGRPIKIEGNPNHPASLGATDAWTQAEILSLYDPDRSQSVTTNGELSSWDQFWGMARKTLVGAAAAGAGGAGIALLTETITSPTLVSQMTAFLKRYPAAKWYQYEPVNRDNVYAGTELAFGQAVSPIYRLRSARVIVSLDSDFLLTDGNQTNVRLAREFTDGRRVRKATTRMNRLYSFESAYTITGAMSDHRFRVKPSQVETIARALYAAVSGGGGTTPTLPTGIDAAHFAALVSDLNANRGAAVVIPADGQSVAVHALAHAINSALGAIGSTVVYTTPAEPNPGGQTAGLKTLVDAMNGGQVSTLIMLGGNPAYDAPADFKFAEALLRRNGGRENVPLRIHLSRYENETSSRCHWHLPEAHPLEAWGDVRAFDGTAAIVQPLVAPLYEGLSKSEFLSGLLGDTQNGYDLVYGYWSGQAAAGTDLARWWERVLHNGVIPNTAFPAATVAARAGVDAQLPAEPTEGDVEITFRADPSIFDGRYANNSWLQELPKPITTIVWDNVAHFSPSTAKRLGIIPSESDNDARDISQVNGKSLVTVEAGGAKLDMPVWILPGQPDGVITVHLGYGRTIAGPVGTDQGFDTYKLRTSTGMMFAPGTAKLTNGSYEIASTQPHHTMRGINEERNRDIVRTGTLSEFIEKHGQLVESEEVPTSPGATAFPGGDKRLANDANADGSLGQEPNMEGRAQGEDEQIVADAYRQEWHYTHKAASNDKGWPTLYPEFSNQGFNAWGMAIDQTVCIGCNACVIACQAENNIPTVGKDQVGRGREMHWIRIDHYYSGDNFDDVDSYFQPMACVHCEKAPCEPVCPVAATVHSHEGLNQMVYNRCIGTRYCSNNCPYKVRRFNFLKWTAGGGGPTTINYSLPALKMLANPEVTVRGRGVMEKCTYCVQRINSARISAKKEEREIQDGEIITACQQVCPTQAIIFGDINNPNSRVSHLRREPHDYSLLADLNTRPRTTYLARLNNPNPAIATAGTGGEK